MNHDHMRRWFFAGLMIAGLWWWAGVTVAEAGTISEVDRNTHLPVASGVTITLKQGGVDVTDTWLPSPGQTVEIVVNGLANPSIRLICPPNSSNQVDNSAGPCPATNASLLDATAPAAAVTVTGATNASPIVITANNHGFAAGEKVAIGGVKGNTAANGVWTITNVTANTFALSGSTGNGTFATTTGSEPSPKAMRWPSVHPFLNATRMTTSAYKGTCTNYGSNTDLSADYTLSGSTLTAHDCGGMAVIKVNDTRFFIIPQDSDADGIPDIYENQFNGLVAIQDLELSPSTTEAAPSSGISPAPDLTCVGVCRRGDGLSNFDEYRGFMVSRATKATGLDLAGTDYEHIRTSPTAKDLFVHVVNGQCAPPTPQGTFARYFPAGGPDLFGFVYTLLPGFQIHLLDFQPGADNDSTTAVTPTLWEDFFDSYSVASGLLFTGGTATEPARDRQINKNAVFPIPNPFAITTVQKGVRLIECQASIENPGTPKTVTTARDSGGRIELTVANHGYGAGTTVVVAGVGGDPTANGTWVITVNTHSALKVTSVQNNGGQIQLTVTNHGYVTGNRVLVAGVGGNPTANGTWQITFKTANTFTLDGSTFGSGYTSNKNSTTSKRVDTFTLDNSTFAGAYTGGGTATGYPTIGLTGFTPWGTPNKPVSVFASYAGNAIVFPERARKDIELKLFDAGLRQIFWAEWTGAWNLYPSAQQLTANQNQATQDFLTTRYIQFWVGHELAHAHRLRPTTASGNHTTNEGSLLNANITVSHEGTTGPGADLLKSTFLIPYVHQTADQQEIRFGH